MHTLLDGPPREARRSSDQANATPAQRQRFGCGDQPPGSLVQDALKQAKPLPDSINVYHDDKLISSLNMLTLFSDGPLAPLGRMAGG